jgi:hypothetical protein
LKVTLSTKLCEPGTGGITLTAKTALAPTAIADATIKFTDVDLTPAFEISSSLKTCILTYSIAWKHTTHDYNKNVREATLITYDTDKKKATVELKATSNTGIDGIHVFDIKVQSLLGADVTGTNTLSLTHKTTSCEVDTLATGTMQTKGPFKHRLGAVAKVFDFSGLYALATSTCAFQYTITVPTELTDYVTANIDVSNPSISMKQIDSSKTAALGRHEFQVAYKSIGGVAQKAATAKFSMYISADNCEKTAFNTKYTVTTDSTKAFTQDLGAVDASLAWAIVPSQDADKTCKFYNTIDTIDTNIKDYIVATEGTVGTGSGTFAVKQNKKMTLLGPYTLKVTFSTIEGDALDTVWTRTVTWTNVCTDDLITYTAFDTTTAPSYTLWATPVATDFMKLVTTKTYDWCLANIVWTFTATTEFKNVADFDTTKATITPKQQDSKDSAKTYEITVNMKLSSTGKDWKFDFKLVDGCTAITSFTMPAALSKTYY